MHSTTDALVAAIHQAYPDLTIHTVEQNKDGQYNDVLLINNELIFRFPRFAAGIDVLQHELSVLNHLRGRLSLPIPEPAFVRLDSEHVGQVFMGYRRLPGESLSDNVRLNITDETIVARLANQLAAFLHMLHTAPVGDLPQHLSTRDGLHEWERLYGDIEAELFPHMPSDAQALVARQFQDFLNQSDQPAFVPALRHGDFGSGNILYDKQLKAITGIIDFGFAGLGDPAVDIAAAMTLGDNWFKHLCTAYPNVEQLLPRAKFYRSTFPLQAALYGLRHGDEEEFRSGLEPYV
jgi:aminoglycoside 2''-phosphotransferase